MAAEDDEVQTVEWWEHERCPFESECSETTFKKWRCWGPTIEDANERLRQHLLGCGHHSKRASMDAQSIEEALSGAVPVQKSELWRPRKGGSAKKRRRRGGGGRGGGGGKDSGKGDGAAEFEEDEASELPPESMADLIDRVLETRLRQMADSSAAAAPSSAAVVRPTPSSAKGGGKSRSYAVSEQEYRSLAERVRRVSNAARSAARLSSMAASNFRDEAEVFEEVAAHLEAQLATGGMALVPRPPRR